MKNLFNFKIWLVFAVLMFVGVFSKVNAQQYPSKSAPQTILYRDLGTYSVTFADGSVLAIRAYVLKQRNNNDYYGQYQNQFTLVAESKSVSRGYYTETWLYGVRVNLNDIEVSYQQYPQGYTIFVKTTPTVIYNWYTNDNDIGKYTFQWANSQYVLK